MTTPEAIAEAMTNWNKLETAARAKHPLATADEIYEITEAAMKSSLGIGREAKVAGDAQ